jgi:TolA-binding protein
MIRQLVACLAVVVGIAVLAAPAPAQTNVAVFNFQMKSDTADWRWLEKGLSDRIATDFVQSKGLSVIARDEMQVLAEKMRWVPEMATSDPERVKEIREKLRIEYLVTGVYSVTGGQITITGQVVEVEGRKEVARKEVSGKADEVLDLQRRLSAELLSWFSKRPPAEILETLPVWTRSLPAAKALYAGMDLYDQGRYAEAWLDFRQASKDDPQYLEAQYWVGKMYYFMNRYEHARRSLEHFVYLDTVHPRVGDAIVEYLHTYERLNPPINLLLDLYANFQRRLGDARIPFEGNADTSSASEWLTSRRAQLLAEEKRYDEAVRLLITCKQWELLTPYKMRLHLLTGQPVDRQSGWETHGQALCFSEAIKELAYRGVNYETNTLDDLWPGRSEEFRLYAPSGMAFKSLRFTPESGGDNKGTFTIYLGKEDLHASALTGWGGVAADLPSRVEPMAAAVRSGVVVDNLTPSGAYAVVMDFSVRQKVDQVRITAELEPLGPRGAIEVLCTSTPHFQVEVDGRIGRIGPGLVGLIAPGKHRVTFRPSDPKDPLEPWETTTVVQAGKTTRVVGQMTWKKDGPFRDWPQPVLVGSGYGVHDCTHGSWPMGSLEDYTPPPAILADEDSIRLIWSYQGDLWSSVSTDGRIFTPPQRLDLPVSSGWTEWHPRLERDEEGRFVLFFESNRDAQHRNLVYRCWSRDFEHWSAPAVAGQGADGYPRDPYVGVVAHQAAAIIHHPRWGYVVAWTQQLSSDPACGPFLICGPSLDLLSIRKTGPGTREGIAQKFLEVADSLLAESRKDAAKEKYENVAKGYGDTPAAATARARLAAIDRKVDPGRKEYARVSNVLDDLDQKSYAYGSETRIGGALLRRRCTALDTDAAGRKRSQTVVAGFYGPGPLAGLLRFRLNAEGVEKFLSANHADCRPDLNAPDTPCGLDDPDKVTDAQLEAYAFAIYEGYDAKKRLTSMKGEYTGPEDYWGIYNAKKSPTSVTGKDAESKGYPGHKFAYVDNKDFPSSPKDYDYLNTWQGSRRIQPLDAASKPAPGSVRVVEFYSPQGPDCIILKVVQTMDYLASPRPRIRSYSITHLLIARHRSIFLSRGPQECANYAVEIEDVETGDEALRGQWVKVVRAPDEPALREQYVEEGRKGELAYKVETMLREARHYEQEGSTETARRAYQTIIDQFPGTPEAATARQRLEELKESGGNPKP